MSSPALIFTILAILFILAYFIYVFLSFAYGDADIKSDSLKDGYWVENQLLKSFPESDLLKDFNLKLKMN